MPASATPTVKSRQQQDLRLEPGTCWPWTAQLWEMGLNSGNDPGSFRLYFGVRALSTQSPTSPKGAGEVGRQQELVFIT